MRYRYALSPSGAVIDIASHSPGDRDQLCGLSCFGCGGEVVPVLGAVREAHFRHMVDRVCSRETYLHALGKRTVIEVLQSARAAGQPYWLVLPAERICTRWANELGHICELEKGARRFDLTAMFDTVEEEASVGAYVADVLLSNSRTGEKLLIEVAVSHRCEPAKLQSGYRIIEVAVSTEDDLANLRLGLDVSYYGIQAYNLKAQIPIRFDCSGSCDQPITAFHVYRSGRSRFQTDRPALIAAEKRKEATVYTHVIDDIPHGIMTPFLVTGGFRKEAERASRAGAPIKCCLLCRYVGDMAFEKAAFCKWKRQDVGANEAADCKAYRPEVR